MRHDTGMRLESSVGTRAKGGLPGVAFSVQELKSPRVLTRSALIALALALLTPLVGCGPSYRQLRFEGQQAMIGGTFGPARIILREAEEKRPRNPENLYDLGTCSMMLAKERFATQNTAAAMRELDEAVDYFTASIDAAPGFTPSIVGKTTALELKGQFDEALRNAEWAAEFVGPAAAQFLYLAQELEKRGDLDSALLRYRQAVSLEPNNVDVHLAIAKFLLAHNNDDAAVFHLQAAYRLNPSDQWVVTELMRRGAVPTLAADRPANQSQP